MKLVELIKELEEVMEVTGEDAEVRIAYQRNYPLQGEISHVVDSGSIEYERERNAGAIVWIAESSQVYSAPYAPRAIWEE